MCGLLGEGVLQVECVSSCVCEFGEGGEEQEKGAGSNVYALLERKEAGGRGVTEERR